MIVQACKPIQQMIEETDVAAVRATLPGDLPYDPYPYQWATHRVTAQEIRDYENPFIIKAAVSAGKTTLISLVTRRLRDIGKSALVLSRQGEIVEQDSDEMNAFKVINSRFCASLNKRSAHFPIVCGSEGTVVNALWPGKKLAAEGIAKPFVPQFLLIDECLTGDTIIETDCGFFRIDDPIIKHMKIKCIDEDSGVHYFDKPKRVFSNGTKHVSSLKLKSGESIRCTENHKLLSKGSWVRADSLNVGDCLTLSGRQDSFLRKLHRACVAVARRLAQKVR